MHNIDRTLQEFETGTATNGEFERYDTSGEYGQELEYGHELELEAQQEQAVGELAQELLEISNEQELNQFLGDLVSQAAGAASKLLTSPAGQSVGRYLVGVAKDTLPQLGAQLGSRAGSALGADLGPVGARVGGWAGGKVGQWAGTQAADWAASKAQRVFGLELEMLSPEAQALEISQAYVRFASDVARRAERALRRNPGLPLGLLGRQVLGAAAPLYAPGLLPGRGRASTGSWERRGNAIVLYGV